MHELSITESILEIVQRHASQAEAKHVTDIFLVIGQLSSIVDESINFYWDIIAENTIAMGAVLHFRRIPAQFLCRECKTVFPLQQDDYKCPACASSQFTIVAGREFFLEAINVES
jgi:hydrogenase nickel incorporation protein HypA/HybF